MHDYLIFGGCLRSELAFPELPLVHDTPPDWRLRVSAEPPSAAVLETLGETRVGGGPVRLHRTSNGFRLDYHDTGSFDISTDGSEIVWAPLPGSSFEAARLDVIGRVLGTAIHASGALTLHGSAVALDGRAVAFVAPKYHGKSTLAMALVRAGGRLITDDTLPVELGPPPRAWPGVHRVRLWSDSVTHLDGAADRGAPARESGKHVVASLPDDKLALEHLPLDAIYVLAPSPPGNGAVEPVRRAPLTSPQAALALMRHARIGDLLGGSEAAVLFDRAVTLARHVSVFRLDVARDFGHLGTVAARLTQWHQEPVSASEGPALVG